MRKAALLGAIVGALGVGLVASSAVAAPVGSAALRIEPASTVEKVHHRSDRRYRDYRHRHHHYRHYGHWHYRRHHHHHHVGLFPLLLLPFIALALAH
jgi:UDP-N-acetylmuramyl pentapeptide phosphotransferase/UDP-N-acetylglucosamine-1-phosphate transferase